MQTRHFIILLTHLLTLCNQLGGVEFGHHTLQHFVADWRQNLLVVVQSQLSVHCGQINGIRTRQDAQRNVNHLQILGSRRRWDLPWARSDIIDDRILEPWNAEVESFGVDLFLDAAQTIENNGTMSTLHCKRQKNTQTISKQVRCIT